MLPEPILNINKQIEMSLKTKMPDVYQTPAETKHKPTAEITNDFIENIINQKSEFTQLAKEHFEEQLRIRSEILKDTLNRISETQSEIENIILDNKSKMPHPIVDMDKSTVTFKNKIIGLEECKWNEVRQAWESIQILGKDFINSILEYKKAQMKSQLFKDE